MTKTPKTGLDALLRPEDSILVLIDHEPYQFANLNSHEPTMIVNNVIALAKTANVFNAAGPAIGHHNIGRLKWRSGPPDGPAAVTGMDVAHFEQGRIHSLYVFLEPADA